MPQVKGLTSGHQGVVRAPGPCHIGLMACLTPRFTPADLARLLCLGLLMMGHSSCVEHPALRQALKQVAAQGRQQLLAQRDGASTARGEDRGLAVPHGAESTALDSLLRLATQDVGVDPQEGSVQKAIWRVRIIKLNLASARQSLDNSRKEIFNLAATGEEKKALDHLDEVLANAPDSLKGEIRLERRKVQDEAIDKAKADGRLQEKRLSAEQAGRVGLLLYNLGVGVVCENLALRHSQEILDDFTRVKDELFNEGGMTGALAWVSLAAWHREFLAIPGDVRRIVAEAPAQISALGAMMGTLRVLKQNNPIPEREAKPGDSFESMEDF